MDLRLVVGGLIARNAVLSTLLANHDDRLEQRCSGHGTTTAPCFIVLTWSVDESPFAPSGSQLLRVEVHTSNTDPRRHQDLDTIVRLLHAVLTDDHARTSITARRLGGWADSRSSLDTVVEVGVWEIAPARSSVRGTARPRLLPWPDSSTLTATGSLAWGTVSMN
ncbi:hypothetical protein [Geodermatophilus sp. CPCC 205506]|uniref:hypothetical protein n=1 Tax=Geodermatophilus sp. CPCC 205506 TaxID=2936596 RepID=UPI003EEE15CA